MPPPKEGRPMDMHAICHDPGSGPGSSGPAPPATAVAGAAPSLAVETARLESLARCPSEPSWSSARRNGLDAVPRSDPCLRGDRDAGSSLFGDPVWRRLAQRLSLSGRELQIVRAIFDGDKETGMARVLGMSPHTVHEHVRRLHRKLGVTDRVQLVLFVVRECLGPNFPPTNYQLVR